MRFCVQSNLYAEPHFLMLILMCIKALQMGKLTLIQTAFYGTINNNVFEEREGKDENTD